MSFRDTIIGFASALGDIAAQLQDKSLEWWWLDNGKRPIITVSIVEVKFKRKFPAFWKKVAEVSFYPSNPLSLYGAVLTIKKNMEALAQVDTFSLLLALTRVGEDIKNVSEAIVTVRDAHKVVEKLARLVEEAEKAGAKDVANSARRAIMEIADTIATNYRRWQEVKASYEKLFEDLSERLKAAAKVAVPVPEKKVEAVEKKVEEAEAEEVAVEEEVETA